MTVVREPSVVVVSAGPVPRPVALELALAEVHDELVRITDCEDIDPEWRVELYRLVAAKLRRMVDTVHIDRPLDRRRSLPRSLQPETAA